MRGKLSVKHACQQKYIRIRCEKNILNIIHLFSIQVRFHVWQLPTLLGPFNEEYVNIAASKTENSGFSRNPPRRSVLDTASTHIFHYF